MIPLWRRRNCHFNSPRNDEYLGFCDSANYGWDRPRTSKSQGIKKLTQPNEQQVLNSCHEMMLDLQLAAQPNQASPTDWKEVCTRICDDLNLAASYVMLDSRTGVTHRSRANVMNAAVDLISMTEAVLRVPLHRSIQVAMNRVPGFIDLNSFYGFSLACEQLQQSPSTPYLVGQDYLVNRVRFFYITALHVMQRECLQKSWDFEPYEDFFYALSGYKPVPQTG